MHNDILIIPSPKLKTKAQLVTEFDTDMLFTLTNSMLRTLDEYYAVGLAATQLGLPMRVLVAKPVTTPFVLINPILKKTTGEYTSEEGCLSVPGYWDKITRFKNIEVEYQNIKGDTQTDKFEDFDAAVIQHEIDHLDGILFIDHLSDLRQSRARKRVERWKRQNNLKHKSKRSPDV